MALHSFAVVVVLVSCLLASPAIVASLNINISTYWGTNVDEGNISHACNISDVYNTSLYRILNIGFIDTFGNLTLDGHCDPSNGGCKYLGAEIKKCQNNGTKVLLSIGRNNTLENADDAKKLAILLWNNYLGGESSDRPLGDDTVLDGIDFFIDAGTTQYLDVLAQTLRHFIKVHQTQMELSATPKCQFPDHYLHAAIQTGVFDYVQVRFYNESACEYNNGSFEAMNRTWNVWTADDKVQKVFAGVTAFLDEGYVAAHALVCGFVQDAMNSSKFGGVMVWNYYADHHDHYPSYSEQIKRSICPIQTTPPSGVEVE